jgi:Receptor family ligand binding region
MSVLNTLAQFKEWRRRPSLFNNSDATVTRKNIVDVVQLNETVTIQNSDGTTTTTSEIPFMSLILLMSFSGYSPDRAPLENGVLKSMAASLLAIEHLNTRNMTLVKEIGDDYMQECPLRFTFEAFDDALSEKDAVDHVINLVSRTENLPSAFLGTSRSAISIPTAIITGLRGYPQISPISTSTQLNDAKQFPLFGRTVPSDDGTAVPVILYLRYTLGIKYLAVVHVNDAYGNAFAQGLQLAASEHAPDMQIRSFDFPFQVSDQVIEQTIGLLKQTQFRYFFGIFFSSVHYKPIMTEAYHQEIAGTGVHNW